MSASSKDDVTMDSFEFPLDTTVFTMHELVTTQCLLVNSMDGCAYTTRCLWAKGGYPDMPCKHDNTSLGRSSMSSRAAYYEKWSIKISPDPLHVGVISEVLWSDLLVGDIIVGASRHHWRCPRSSAVGAKASATQQQ
jgi:hypothetical protein